MIKTFLFDCGNVLMSFSREALLDVYVGDNEADRKLIFDTVFTEWHYQDEGTPSMEFFESMKKLLPERLHKSAYNLIFHWKEKMWKIEGMEEFVKEIKEKGYPLYLLSNMPETFTYDHDDISVLKYFDGLVFSYDIKCAKPEAKFYNTALERYSLNPSECLFIDDCLENIEGAKKVGINTYLFDTNNPKEFIEYARKEILK